MSRQSFLLQHTEGQSDAAVVASFAAQYYTASTDHPRTVITRHLPSDADDLRRALQLRFEAPTRGKRRKLVVLAEANAADELARRRNEWLSREARAKLGLAALAKALLMTESLRRIECYDISNVQGANAVGSMIVFEDGQPKKSEYRKFRIRTVVGANDYAMLREVMRRRFGHRTTAGRDHWPDPDLIIVDGGKGQLNAVLSVLRDLRVILPTIGLAKRQEEIFRPGQKDSLRLPRDSEGLYLLQRIRDEAHRFAIGYYRQRHGQATTKSLLDEIPGIGPKSRQLLLERFGSIEGIRSADDALLENLLGQKRAAHLRERL